MEVARAHLKSRMTCQIAAMLISQLALSSIKGVAREHDVSYYRNWNARSHYVEEAREKPVYSGIRSVGIDETSMSWARNCIAVVAGSKTTQVRQLNAGFTVPQDGKFKSA